MAIPGLYIPIRGDYSDFQKDMARLAGIARQQGEDIANALNQAISPQDAVKGLKAIGSALKQLTAAAQSTGRTLNAPIQELDEFAARANVARSVVEELHHAMVRTARDRQIESNLRTLQRQCGLTASAMARLRAEMGDAAGSVNNAMQGLGIRPLRAIQDEIREVEAQYQHMLEMFRSGHATENDVARAFAARGQRMEALQREAGTWQDPARASALRQRYDTLVAQAGRGRTSFAQFEARDAAKNAVSAFQELNGRLPRPKEIREIAAATGVAANQIRKLRDELDHSSNAFKALIGYAQVWLTFGFANTAIDFVKTAMALENVKVAFQAIYGTADMAQAKLDYVRQVSEQLGLSFLDTAEGAKKLFAAAAGTPVEKEANMVFKAFSDMSAAMKLSGDETKGVFLAISQMISKGKVSAEELRQQLAERMPGAVNLFARSIGKTTQELDKMLQKGEVTLEHFLMFSREVQNTYGPGAIAAGGSLQAEMNRLQNAWVDFKTSMTDTDTLASGVRSLTSMFKALSPVIEFISKHIHTLVTVSLAAWIGSSLAPGGKLSGVLNSIGAAAGKARERVEAFNKGQQAMVIRATGATAAVGKLRAALSGLGSGALYGALFAIGAGLLEIAYNAAKASRGFQNVSKNMSEYVADMTKSQEAMEKSNFAPSMSRKLMLGDIEKERGEFNREYEKVDNSVYSYSTRAASGSYYGGAFMQSGKGGDAEIAHKKAKELWDEFNKAIDAGNIEAAREFQNKAVAVWKGGMEKTVESIGGSLGADINAEWGGMLQKMGTITASGEKYLQTFSSASTDAAKRLGFNAAQMREDLKKLKEAAEKTNLGKALSGIQNMDKIRQTIGDTSIAYTDNAKAIVDAGDKLQNYLNQIQTGANNFKKHQEEVNNQAEAYAMLARYGNVGADAYKELQAAQAGLAGEQKELSQQTDGLAQYITNCALAAGGSETAFRMMESLVRSMAPLFEQLGVSIETVIGKMRDFQIAAANAVYETMALSGAQAAEMQVWGAKGSAAIKKGDYNAYEASRIGAMRAKAENDGTAYPEITPDIKQNIRREYNARREIISINESNRKGGKRGGGGGGKRVDNTQEKYDSAFEGFRKEIAKLRGETDKVTLDKKFADMDKQLKGSTADIKALKKEYFEAFNANKVHELRKEIMQLTGDDKGLAELEIVEKMKAFHAEIDGVREAAQQLGVEAPEDLAKLGEAYEKALRANEQEQYLQKLIPIYEEIASKDEDKVKILELQNQLIGIQAEKMMNSFPPEVVERWREMQMLEHSRNPWDGIVLGLKKYSMETESLAKTMSSAVGQAFDGMADAFTQFVMTGKLSFKDMANSIIADLMRITVKSMILGPIANAIGGALGSLFNGTGQGMNFSGSGAAESASLGLGRHGHAKGDVFTGLHGYSNQIVSRPTLFSYGSQLTRFAKGGVMGEAGPEAVMPLTRMGNGSLGVQAAGGGAIELSLTIVDKTQGGVGVENTQAQQNGLKLDVIVQQIDSKLAGLAASGKSKLVGAMEKTHRMPSTRGW